VCSVLSPTPRLTWSLLCRAVLRDPSPLLLTQSAKLDAEFEEKLRAQALLEYRKFTQSEPEAFLMGKSPCHDKQ
jgi:hypothetical protein